MTWIKPELVLVDLHSENSKQVIEALGGLLFEQGYVKRSFIEAVIERESIFATGLPTQDIQVAIPHADVEHVKKSAIAVGLLQDPVSFGEMGNPDGTVGVQIACCLAVKESDSLVSLLQNLVGIFQDTDFLKELLDQTQAESVANLMNNRLPAYQED
jgi:PTS system galactitol-specific IIA component